MHAESNLMNLLHEKHNFEAAVEPPLTQAQCTVQCGRDRDNADSTHAVVDGPLASIQQVWRFQVVVLRPIGASSR